MSNGTAGYSESEEKEGLSRYGKVRMRLPGIFRARSTFSRDEFV